MKRSTILIAAVSGAAGFTLAALSQTGSSPVPTAPIASPDATKRSVMVPVSSVPAEAVLAEIRREMDTNPTPDTGRAWAQRDPQAFAYWLRHSQPVPSAEVIEVFFDTWRKRDARAAILAACELPDRFRLRTSFLIHLGFPGLFTSEPNTALDLLAIVEARFHPELPEGFHLPLTADPALLDQLHPAAVADRLSRAPASQIGQEFARQYGRYLNRKSGDAAMAWAASLPFPMATAAYEEIVRSTAETSIEAGLKILSRLPSGYVQALQNNSALMREFARQAPGETIAWFNEHVGLVPQNAELDIAYEWLRKDQRAATEWLLTGGNPEDRERRIQAAAGSAAQAVGTSTALTWADALPDEFQFEALGAVVSSPGMNDLQAVLNYLAPQPDGSLTPSQSCVIKALGSRAKSLSPRDSQLLQEWARSPANVSGISFDR